MARPISKGISYFPKWSPHKSTLKKLSDDNFRNRYNALRGSSSSFIKRKDVRKLVFERDNFKCVECGSNKDLQIDHIISVYKICKYKLDYRITNCSSNFQTLCGSCNAKKLP